LVVIIAKEVAAIRELARLSHFCFACFARKVITSKGFKMNIFLRTISIFALLFLSVGCAHNAPIDIAPSYDVYSNYDDKMPGKFALTVDASEMTKEIKPDGFVCSAHTFPVDGASAFETSVLKTFENLVEEVVLLDNPLNQSSLKSQGYRAQLVVKARDLDVDLKVIQGFWTAEIEADVEITASVEAINVAQGKVLGATIEGDADGKAPAGAFCEGGGKAIGIAMQEAMKETMERLGERLTNARRMRENESS